MERKIDSVIFFWPHSVSTHLIVKTGHFISVSEIDVNFLRCKNFNYRIYCGGPLFQALTER